MKPTTHALKLPSSAARIQMACGHYWDDVPNDHLCVGPSHADKITCPECREALGYEPLPRTQASTCGALSVDANGSEVVS